MKIAIELVDVGICSEVEPCTLFELPVGVCVVLLALPVVGATDEASLNDELGGIGLEEVVGMAVEEGVNDEEEGVTALGSTEVELGIIDGEDTGSMLVMEGVTIVEEKGVPELGSIELELGVID